MHASTVACLAFTQGALPQALRAWSGMTADPHMSRVHRLSLNHAGRLTGVYTCAMGTGSCGCSVGVWELSAGPGSEVANGGCGGGGDRAVAGDAGLTAGAGSGSTGARGVATGSAWRRCSCAGWLLTH